VCVCLSHTDTTPPLSFLHTGRGGRGRAVETRIRGCACAHYVDRRRVNGGQPIQAVSLSVWVLCGSPVGPSPPVVGSFRCPPPVLTDSLEAALFSASGCPAGPPSSELTGTAKTAAAGVCWLCCVWCILVGVLVQASLWVLLLATVTLIRILMHNVYAVKGCCTVVRIHCSDSLFRTLQLPR